MAEQDPLQQFAGRRALVMGLGRFGGGVGVTRFLADRGADVLVTDLEPADKLEQSVAMLGDLVDDGAVELRLGGHNVSDFTTCDLVVVNPAVKPGNRFVRAAEAAGVEVTTEMRLLVERLPNRLRTIGVTGSAGKSTVTAMIGHVLSKAFGISDGGYRMADGQDGSATSEDNPQSAIRHPKSPRVWVGGNIGVSLLPQVDEIGEDDWVVLELSSFMLERLRADEHFRGWSPHIAVVTNISPNHLDWHGSMEEYIKAKFVVCQYQQAGDAIVTSEDVNTRFRRVSGRLFWGKDGVVVQCLTEPTPEQYAQKQTRLPGRHNFINACCASAVCSRVLEESGWGDHAAEDQVGEAMASAIATFPGLPHRLQLVAEHKGVRYFNDSKCTTPEAAQLAIEAFDDEQPKPGIHLILGGKDKGSDMKPLAGFAARACKAVYTIGALGDAIAELVDTAAKAASAETQRPESCGGVSWPAETAGVVRCGTLDTAVAEIASCVAPGDVVLLSPACASWDQFENYEQRGQRFIELVKASIAG